MDESIPLCQLLYVSTARSGGVAIDVPAIVEQSRHNNAIDGITGLLWSDGERFLQVLEGPADSVATTFARIKDDLRHDAIVVLSKKAIDKREFGSWSMAARPAGDGSDAFDARMARLLQGASENVRSTFLGLIATRA